MNLEKRQLSPLQWDSHLYMFYIIRESRCNSDRKIKSNAEQPSPRKLHALHNRNRNRLFLKLTVNRTRQPRIRDDFGHLRQVYNMRECLLSKFARICQ